MPTLLDKLKGNNPLIKRGGQLFEQPVELPEPSLLPGATTSPLAAAAVGAKEDEAKMAGSAAQLQKSIRESIAPGREFKEPALRTEATEAEKLRQQRSEQLRNLEGLGTRVFGLVKEAAKVKPTAPVAVPATAVPTAQTQDQGLAKPVFNQQAFDAIPELKALAPADRELVKKAIETGEVDPKLYTILNVKPEALGTELAKYTKPEETTIATIITENFGDSVPLSALSKEDYRALGLADVAPLLGLKDADLKKLTVSELKTKLNALIEQDYNQVDSLSRIANDPFYPENVRKLAQTQLAELSSVGVMATEAEVDRLNKEIQAGEVINVGGKDYTIEELLQDDNLNSIITGYFEDEDYAKEVTEDLPGLAQFIERNRTVLKEASTKLATNIKDLANVQTENAKLDSYGGIDLTGFNTVTIEGYKKGEYRKDRYTPTEAHTLLAGDKLPETDKQLYAGFLNNLSKISPDDAKTFAAYDYTELMKQVDNSGLNFKDYLDKYQSYKQAIIDAERQTPQQVVNSTFGSTEAAQKLLTNYYLRDQLGITKLDPKYESLFKLIDSNNDGKVDDASTIQAAIRAYYNANPDVKLPTVKDLAGSWQMASASDVSDSLFTYLKDGTLTQDEVNKIIEAPDLTVRLYDILNTKGKLISVEGGTIEQVTKALDERLKTEMGPAYTYVAKDINQAGEELVQGINDLYTNLVLPGYEKWIQELSDGRLSAVPGSEELSLYFRNRPEALNERQAALMSKKQELTEAIRNIERLLGTPTTSEQKTTIEATLQKLRYLDGIITLAIDNPTRPASSLIYRG